MPRRVILHIGPRKTGTTFLQRVLHELAPGLAEDGVLYPTRYRERDDYNQVGAVSSLTYNQEARRGNRRIGRGVADWRGLERQVQGFDGDVILSAEMIAGLRPEAATRMLDRLKCQDVTVIITARDLGRILPSSWQQHIRNGHTEPYRAYLQRRTTERGAGDPRAMQGVWDAERHQTFWRAYAYGALVRRWQGLVGDDRVRMVTVPPTGSGVNLLWERFVAVAGVPGLPDTAPGLPPHRANAGSTPAEVAVLRAINVEAKRREWSRYTIKRVHDRILSSGLLDRDGRGEQLYLPASVLPVVRSWAEADIADLLTTGVHVAGDLDELRVTAPVRSQGAVTSALVAQAGAFIALEALSAQPGDLSVQHRRKRRRQPSATQRPASQRFTRRVRRRIARLRPSE
jgi:hypothetical protein